MSSYFDGMAGLLTNILGSSVSHTPVGGEKHTLEAVFREEPVEVTGEDGRDVLVLAPTLKVPADQVAGIVRGSLIDPANGKTYLVLNGQPGGSPADDGFVIFELEEDL
ncbi:head-tail joining protein [Parasedimentitalea huanghaiensis]|uniref:Uncharacterized protein n=1 Tax=Parasedimentitalea huanghaiensis TaxID=2682100 RepID=A0A6L6WAK3_9RHOB|nr:hypothetical protein [Zongyanglinia huanghaiensis]MVO14813.1 hypothetical protein [Zongyanglinia huanghaiensis]